jgi:hypothetical protein
MFLGIIDHLMEWIQAFLTEHNRLVVFEDIWRSIPTYPQVFVPAKPYRHLSQVTGKEMRSILKIILALFTAALRRKNGLPRPTGGQEVEFKKAITCVRYLTDFGLLARYASHTDSTVKYMRNYLRRFHESKGVFLRFRARKAAKAKADEVERELSNRRESRLQESDGLSVAQRAHLHDEDQLERRFLINETLEAESDFNFPKIHLLSHYADQISRYGSLPQYSTESCETAHKLFKNAYRRSNHVDAIPQIIQGYMREHSFAIKELNMEAWAYAEPAIKERVKSILSRKRKGALIFKIPGEEVYMQLQGKRSDIGRIGHLVEEFQIPSLRKHVRMFLLNNIYSNSEAPESDADNLLNNCGVEAFSSVEIPVPEQDTSEQNAYILHHLRCTGKRAWRGKEARHDTAWVRLALSKIQGSLARTESFSGRLPGQINAIFNLRGQDGQLYKLAHVSILQVIGNPTPKGPEGMAYVQVRQNQSGDCVVWLRSLEGVAQLIPVEPNCRWIVNNRIDYHTWNELNDGL